MESKKNTNSSFKQQLDQLDYMPSDMVWERIETDLDKKEKKRRFVIWFFFTCLLTSSLIGGLLYNYQPGSTEKEVGGKTVSTPGDTSTQDKSVSENEKATEINGIGNSSSSTEDAGGSIVNKGNEKSHFNTKSGNHIQNSNNRQTKSGNKQNSTRYASSGKLSTSGKNKNKSLKSNLLKSYNIDKNALSDASKKETVLDSTSNITISETIKNTSVDSLIAATKSDLKKNKKERKPKDSLAVKDSTDAQEIKQRQIIVAPYYGINYGGYFNDFTAISNNPIREQKTGMRDTYGILLRWMTGEKWGIQTGVGKINSRYFSTIDKTDYSFMNAQNMDFDIPYSDVMGMFANETKVKFTYDSSFFEVPLEGYYVIRDQKLGFATSAGLSFLFGNKNNVFAESDNVQKIKIGKLNTIAPFSATINAKLYLFYKITPALQFDLYPTFQYHVMGSTDSDGHTGYFFSVRTGLSYKF